MRFLSAMESHTHNLLPDTLQSYHSVTWGFITIYLIDPGSIYVHAKKFKLPTGIFGERELLLWKAHTLLQVTFSVKKCAFLNAQSLLHQ